MELTKSELEIMNVFWDVERPLTRGEILELSSDKKWKDNSIHILLNRLMAKGALEENGFARSGKSYGRMYRAVLSGEDYYAENVFNCGKKRISILYSAMLRCPELNLTLLEEFEKKLQEKKTELVQEIREEQQ